MNKYFKEFNDSKNKVISVLDKAITFSNTHDLKDLKSTFDSLKKQTLENEFTIVVVGEFSAGKSTFINALMGERFLPSATKETTATVNFLRHINQAEDDNNIVIHYKNGKIEKLKKEVNLENINNYVSTNGTDVASSIDKVEVFIESKFLENNVTLIDSPGLNGTADGHRDITMEQISKSHACIFMFDARQPGKQTDFDFLNKIKEKTQNLFFLLNQIDVIKQDEGETIDTVKESVKENYRKKNNGNLIPELYGISSIKALVSRSEKSISFNNRKDFSNEEKEILLKGSQIEEFEERLLRFLTKGEKAKSQLTEPIAKIEKELLLLTDKNNQNKEALNETRDGLELDEEIHKIQEEVELVKSKLKEEIRGVQKTIRNLKRENTSYFRNSKKKIKKEAESYLENCLVDVEELIEDNDLSDISARLKKKIINRISEIQDEALDLFKDGLSLHLGEVDIKLKSELKLDNVMPNYSEIDTSSISDLEAKNEANETAYKTKQKDLRKKRNNLLEEKSLEESNKHTVRVLESEKQGIRREKNEVRIESNRYEKFDNITEIDTKTRMRKGLLGMATTLIFGKKEYTEEVKKQVENKNYEEFEKNRRDSIANYDDELTLINENLSKLQEEQRSQRATNYSELDLEEDKEELKEERARKKKRSDREYSRIIKKIKRKIIDVNNDLITNLLESSGKCFEKNIEENTSKIEQNSISNLENSLVESVKNKEQKLHNKKELKESSDSDKNKKLEEIASLEGSIKELRFEILEIQDTLEMLEIDTVKQEK